jgi:hypothetical protein
MWGTGSHVGHSTVVLTVDGVKSVVESQDAWYWPVHSIQQNPWKEWVQYADNCDMIVVVLPLTDELRAKFDHEAAEKWFKLMEGVPYGYHNFLFSWIDTPDHNLPSLLPKELLPIVFDLFDHISHDTVETFFLQAMNFRLGTKNLGMKEVTAEAARQGMTFEELMAMPEQDHWVYSDGPSYVCSCFVIGIYKAAGLFGDMDIQATEFTPKDVYQLNFYNTTAVLPEQCT